MYKVLPLWSDKNTVGVYCAIVDSKHWRRIKKYRWRVSFSGGNNKMKYAPYAKASIKGRYVYLHRFVKNCTDPKVDVDHLNHQTLDCRDCNLEVTEKSVNQQRKRNRRKS